MYASPLKFSIENSITHYNINYNHNNKSKNTILIFMKW